MERKTYPFHYGGVKQNWAEAVVAGGLAFVSGVSEREFETGRVTAVDVRVQTEIARPKINSILEEIGTSFFGGSASPLRNVPFALPRSRMRTAVSVMVILQCLRLTWLEAMRRLQSAPRPITAVLRSVIRFTFDLLLETSSRTNISTTGPLVGKRQSGSRNNQNTPLLPSYPYGPGFLKPKAGNQREICEPRSRDRPQ